MKDYVPLFQTLLWVVMILGLIFTFRLEIKLVREVFAERLRQGAAFKLGPVELGELRAELHVVRTELDEVNQKIAKLFLTTISQPMYENLRKLASGHFGSYEKSGVMERELYHLRDVGYVAVTSISAIPKSGPNLSQYVEITKAGKEFVELREAVYRESD